MELIKSTIRVGNSAGVLLPKQWLNSKVRIVLQPLNIEKEVLDIFLEKGILKDTLGIYLIGSCARGEQTIESDIDILAITDKTNKQIKEGRYEILLISKKKIEEQLKQNAFPLLPMLKEAKPLLNAELIERYKDVRLTKRNSKWHIDTTKSAMRFVKTSIDLSREMGLLEGDATSYSLVLRLRTLYIIDCLRKNKLWNKKEFLKLIKKISGSLIAYEEYLKIKNDKEKILYKLPIDEAEKLMNYINKEVEKVEKWLRERKG